MIKDEQEILNNEIKSKIIQDIDLDEDPVEDFVDLDENGDEIIGASAGQNTIKKLRDKVKALETEKSEYMLNWQRALADYKNREKQITDEKKEWGSYAVKRFTEDLLTVMDTYDAARSNTVAWEVVDANWRAGIEYIFNTFESKLADQGFEKFGIVGEDFDPKIHEGLGTMVAAAGGDHSTVDTVAQVIMSGYKYRGQLFRPAKVKVWVESK